MSILKTVRKITGPKGGVSEGSCLSCGICCELYGHSVVPVEEDLARWTAEGREDILAWAKGQAAGREVPCPFLRRDQDNRGVCSINHTKPVMCRRYPTSAHRNICVMGIKFLESGEAE